jgi:aminopeptidase N
VVASDPAVSEVPLGETEKFFGINAGEAGSGRLKLKRYRAAGAPASVKLSYEGVFDFGLGDQKEEYTRGFRETSGLLNDQGVYLAGSGFWYPYVSRELIEFKMEIVQPEGWHVISQGNGTSRDALGKARWESHGPMDEIYLVGGPLRVYRDSAGAVETLVYIHEKDDALAAKYLEATAQYIEMYRALLGPYPYGKFALVENFWETGYGMPSFTLLGPQIIRFPFILASSYPHEILHNWWGNSVFVDYESGNWCEGLTSYLADHLIQEQRGKGGEYRQSTLQKYRDFVKDGRDFPLTEFRSRHSAATEAVGYGRTMMGFHMLRHELGDDNFKKLIQRFYREFREKRATFRDIQKVAEAVSGKDLKRFFDDWITRPGAATLAVSGQLG